MLVLGLTGPSGSGKGIVGRFFEEQGIPVLDTDAVYHALIAKPSACTEELKAVFGDTIITSEGGVNRKRLAELVFDPTDTENEKLSHLNRITHRYVLDACRLWLKEQAENKKRAAVIDAPLLYESGFDKECDRVIALVASRQVRLARIILRDGLTAEEGERRLSSQKTDGFYTERADFVIRNEGDVRELKEAVLTVIDRLPIA